MKKIKKIYLIINYQEYQLVTKSSKPYLYKWKRNIARLVIIISIEQLSRTIYRAMRAKAILYLTILIIHIAAIINKPQNIKQLSVKNTSTKYAKNQLQDIIGRVVIRKALISKSQFQELLKKISIYKLILTQLFCF